MHLYACLVQHQTMNRLSPEAIQRSNLSSPPPPPPPPLYVDNTNFQNKISPSILLIIVILAVIFFISGLLHLLVRYLLRPPSRDPDELDDATALQGQLQQLFHLHDAGVDQSFIDALPVFLYRAVIGLKDPFDCAVCLCEFDADDRLRLLPKCSHAFHVDCIDTWLLSHSTCPLCRSSLLPPDYSPASSCSPVLLVLESAGGDSFREVGSESRLEIVVAGGDVDDFAPLSHDIPPKAAENHEGDAAASDEKIVSVKLGKFRSVEVCGGEGEGSGGDSNDGGGNDTNLDQRRCFSMGSYEYVMDEASSLKVPIKPPKKKPAAAAAAAAALKWPGHRLAMSECDGNSRREGFKGFDAPRICDAAIQKRESFSVSKTWLRPKKDCAELSRQRAASFRLPFHHRSEEPRRKTAGGGELELDLAAGSSCSCSCSSSSSSSSKRLCSRADEAPSFARRTLNWIVGRQNRVGNHL